MPEIAGVGILLAFLAGLVSFMSPCVLPLVPGYVSYVAGRSLEELSARQAARERFAALGLSLFFVAGFSAVFVTLGASATGLGRLFLVYRYEANYLAGTIIVLFGLHTMGLLRLNWMMRDWRVTAPIRGGRPAGAFMLGTAFAFGWTPCIGPILGTILTLSATTVGVTDGIALLAIYSSGLAIPFILVAAFTGRFMDSMGRLRRIGRPLQQLAGGIMVLMGIGIVTGYMTYFASWLLRTFPVFQELLL
jgi:cytochrome c-type biogenesis protein